MDGEKFGIAVIGAGMASAPHLASLQALHDRATVHYVVARSAARAEAFASHLAHAEVSLDLETVLEDPRVDGVLLLTPPNTHLELGVRIAEAGKHLLVEKPVDVTSNRAHQLVSSCEAQGVVAAAVLQHRTRAAAVKLRQLLQTEALGPIHSASVSVPWWRPQSYYDEPGRGTHARDGGGVLMTQAIHTLDLFIWLLGSPREVFAYAVTGPAHQMECEDTVAGVMKYSSGCVVSLFASTASVPGFPERIEVSGVKGTAVLSAGRIVVRFADGSGLDEGEEAALGAGADPMAFSHQPHQAVIHNFIEAATGRAEPIASLRSALQVQLLIDALIESSVRNQPLLVKSPS